MTNELVNEYGEMCKITINRTIYRKNELLINWINKNNYKVIEYNGKARKNRNEIIVVNYEVIK